MIKLPLNWPGQNPKDNLTGSLGRILANNFTQNSTTGFGQNGIWGLKGESTTSHAEGIESILLVPISSGTVDTSRQIYRLTPPSSDFWFTCYNRVNPNLEGSTVKFSPSHIAYHKIIRTYTRSSLGFRWNGLDWFQFGPGDFYFDNCILPGNPSATNPTTVSNTSTVYHREGAVCLQRTEGVNYIIGESVDGLNPALFDGTYPIKSFTNSQQFHDWFWLEVAQPELTSLPYFQDINIAQLQESLDGNFIYKD